MTPVWHDGPLDRLDWDGQSPLVWRTRDPGRGQRAPLANALVGRLSGAAVQLARSIAGAPQVAAPPGWFISFAGRDGQCLIAAADRPIAVDHEVIDDVPPLWDMLTEAEARAVRAAADPPRQWLRRWTIKEAHAKLIGEPRRIAPPAIDTRLIDDCEATAACEGVSHCWTREQDGAIDTVALWV
ncbi:4'-phosphopantetheinyl transferase superfamily protein [Sphingomonas fuzhouensis]|uniref:4'-phosphopantetheinyl transferase superfamily protein n=1 Tax=Sphingomonas fuzhouensis TaxID=3106033 RepID=UPI002AFEE0BB|nr:4'-phosphopantetheinyl transferase superfamily protein [Sphingomonas sp. SGZ-02]